MGDRNRCTRDHRLPFFFFLFWLVVLVCCWAFCCEALASPMGWPGSASEGVAVPEASAVRGACASFMSTSGEEEKTEGVSLGGGVRMVRGKERGIPLG